VPNTLFYDIHKIKIFITERLRRLGFGQLQPLLRMQAHVSSPVGGKQHMSAENRIKADLAKTTVCALVNYACVHWLFVVNVCLWFAYRRAYYFLRGRNAQFRHVYDTFYLYVAYF